MKLQFLWQQMIKIGKIKSVKKDLVFLTPLAHTKLLSLPDYHNMLPSDSSVTSGCVVFQSHDRKYEQLSAQQIGFIYSKPDIRSFFRHRH